MELLKRMAALQKQVEWLTEELASTNRRLENIIRLGTVAQANADTVDIQTGANLAKGAPFFVPAAGRVKHYRRPSVGEQCILINLGSGDNLNNAVALMGLRSNLYPFPTLKENEVMTDYGGGMKEVYDLDKGKLVASYPGGVEVYAPNFKNHGEITDAVRSMSEDREIYNKHDHLSPETSAPTTMPRQKQ